MVPEPWGWNGRALTASEFVIGADGKTQIPMQWREEGD